MSLRRPGPAEPVEAPPPAFPAEQALDGIRVQAGWLQSRAIRSVTDIGDAEFGVFSQWGEDGIIQFLTQRVPIENDVFIEFGVQDYRESNTRFLLVKDNWRGLIIDADEGHHAFLRDSGLDWRHQIDAVTAFIDRDNINQLILNAGLKGDIGLLSVDLDGNDYWVLDAINAVSPRILIVEYNSLFGPEAAITVPYDPHFERGRAHHSNLYWGASLTALARLADRKGYALVGSSAAGSNAFFVRRDVLGDLPETSVGEAYVRSRFRESRGEDGEMTLVSAHRDRIELIRHLPVFDIDTERELTLGERLG